MDNVRQVIAPDVSRYQPPVDDRFARQWLIFRCCDAGTHDARCEINRTWCERALREGRLLGWTAYMVYRPGRIAEILDHAAMLPAGGHAEIDIESWGGSIRSDHSDEINQLAQGLQRIFPGQLIPGLPRVGRYGNRGDLDSIHPRNTLKLPTRVAKYSVQPPTDPTLWGWQYTDGSTNNPVPAGYPRSSTPFGNCDHNVLYLPVTPPVPQPQEADDDMDLIIFKASNSNVKALYGGGHATVLQDQQSVDALKAAGIRQASQGLSDRDFAALTGQGS